MVSDMAGKVMFELSLTKTKTTIILEQRGYGSTNIFQERQKENGQVKL